MNRDDFLSIDAIRFGWNELWKNISFFVILMIIVTVLSNLSSLLAAFLFGPDVSDGTLLSQDAPRILLTATVSLIVYVMLELGMLRIALNFKDNNKAELKDLFREYPKLINYALATVLFGLMIILPFSLVSTAGALLQTGNYGAMGTIILAIVFLIVLAAVIYLFLKYQFYGYVIVDRGLGPVEALKGSGRLTEGILKNLFIFWLEMGLGIALALAVVGIFIELILHVILLIISEDLASLGWGLVSFTTRLFIIVPIIKLAMADIYRRLEQRAGDGLCQQMGCEMGCLSHQSQSGSPKASF